MKASVGGDSPSTLVELVGELTPSAAHRLYETLHEATRFGQRAIVSFAQTAQVSWAGVCRLSELLQNNAQCARAVSFAGVAPHKRSLMAEAGFDRTWFARENPAGQRRIIVSSQ